MDINTLFERFMSGLGRFDRAMVELVEATLRGLLIVLGIAVSVAFVVALALTVVFVLGVAWAATGIMERIGRRLWTHRFGALVYMVIVVPIYIYLVVRTEVGVFLAFVPGIHVWLAILLVVAINAICIWWHKYNERMWPAIVYRIYRHYRPLPPAVPPAPPAPVVITVRVLKDQTVRDEPRPEALVIGHLKIGDKVEVFQVFENGWAKLAYGPGYTWGNNTSEEVVA